MFRFMLQEDVSQFDLSSIQHCCIAGEPLNPEVFKQWEQLTGLKLYEGFGQSESSVLIANFSPWITPKPGSTGKPSPLYDIDLINSEGKPCEDGEEGEIVVRLKGHDWPTGLFTGYYLDDEMTKANLGGEWYIDEMKTRANEAAGVPFTLPRSKYWYRNDYVPVYERVNRPVEAREAIEFFASDDQRTKVQLSDGSSSDYLPSKTLMLPVDKQNVLRSGIVAEKDKDLIVDTVYIKLSGDYLNKGELMIVDMLSNYDWTRPIYLTQPYIFQKFGLVDYLQFDGYAYRFVPILTPVQNPWEIGRIDADYAAPLLKETFRYGNLADPRVYADYFIQYNLSASHARDAFARVAKELLRQDRAQEAVELLDMGLEKLPPSQIRFTDSNTYPFLEAYYAASAMGVEDAADKGDALLREYARTLIEYIEYYLRFDGVQGDMVSPIIDEKLDQLGDVYYLAVYAGRKEIIGEINAYYRSLGVEEENLVDVGDKPHQVDTTLIPRKDTAQ